MATATKKNNGTVINEGAEESAPVENKLIVPKDIDLNQLITVRNGFQGRLVYVSPRTKERFIWDEFGDEQELDLRELRNAKSSAKKFFSNNWFMFDDEFAWVINYLGVKQFYKNAIKLDEFDDVFKQTPAKIKEAISKLSPGQKESIGYRARQLVLNKEIDSLKAIEAIEEALGVELIER